MKMMNNVTGIIYKATNTVNDMVYVGATTKSIEERKQDHIQKSYTGVGHYFQEAIATYGAEAFSWEQIDTAISKDELALKEIHYIRKYDSVYNGYNCDKGGGFKKTVYQYNLDGTFKHSYPNLTIAALSVGSSKKKVSKACWSVNHTLGGFLWSYEFHERFQPAKDGRKKEVQQFTLNGNLLAKYVSASEATRNSGGSKTCIT
jgi:group I intron endonuclease